MREWLIAIREDQNMTQKKIAERAGIAQATYSNIESGKRSVGVPVAKRIAAVLGFEWTKFFE